MVLVCPLLVYPLARRGMVVRRLFTADAHLPMGWAARLLRMALAAERQHMALAVGGHPLMAPACARQRTVREHARLPTAQERKPLLTAASARPHMVAHAPRYMEGDARPLTAVVAHPLRSILM